MKNNETSQSDPFNHGIPNDLNSRLSVLAKGHAEIAQGFKEVDRGFEATAKHLGASVVAHTEGQPAEVVHLPETPLTPETSEHRQAA